MCPDSGHEDRNPVQMTRNWSQFPCRKYIKKQSASANNWVCFEQSKNPGDFCSNLAPMQTIFSWWHYTWTACMLMLQSPSWRWRASLDKLQTLHVKSCATPCLPSSKTSCLKSLTQAVWKRNHFQRLGLQGLRFVVIKCWRRASFKKTFL